jgi:hypothetical protein
VRYARIRVDWLLAKAEDLIQGFFARLLEKNDLAAVDPSNGEFR